MNVYIIIALLGLAAKIMVTHNVLIKHPMRDPTLRLEIILAAAVFIPYSVPQILLLAPDSWGHALGLERYQVLRIYYYHGTLALISGLYSGLSLLGYSFQRNSWVHALIVAYAVSGAIGFIFTDALVAAGQKRLPFEQELGSGNGFAFVLATRITVVILVSIAIYQFYKRYRSANSNAVQITSYYAIAAGLLFFLNYLLSLFFIHPLFFATRGLFFFLAMMLIARDASIFDARPITPITLENKVARDLVKTFTAYSNEEIGHKDAVRKMEQQMVNYKLEKITGFKDTPGSSLPEVATSMRVNLSSLYDIIKRLNLSKDQKK